VKAVDTNILVRLLVGDDPAQRSIAVALFSSGDIWISKTVLLETAWVLGSAYAQADSQIRDGFVALLGLANVAVEDSSSVTQALSLVAQGMAFADALHLTSCPPGARFYSFDKAFVRRAKRAGFAAVSEA